jgi:hypothetical protein
MKVRITNEFGQPLNLSRMKGSMFQFTYEQKSQSDVELKLEKYDAVVTDSERGEMEIILSEFEVQGLKSGPDQDFFAEIYFDDWTYRVQFVKALTVSSINGRKILGHVN